MKLEGKPWVVPAGGSVTCPISEEKFGEGEPVMKGHYYARVAESLYEYRPNLGCFIVPASMLRAGGKQDPLRLAVHVPRSTRNAGRSYFKLSTKDQTRI